MKTLISEQQLQTRITEMALEIDSYYMAQEWYRNTQEPVIVVGVLTGALFFMADLIRKLSIRIELDFMRVSTYPGKATVAQKPKIITPPDRSLRDAHILLVDDILDTGKTIKVVKKWLSWPVPEDIWTCVLLRKPDKNSEVKADFVGFDVPDEFLIGYGLDHDGKFREMPYVAFLSEEEMSNESFASKKEVR
ncbi:hypothetical protein LCGC14_0141280 [marine sediment metagenome]|uniref:hypoxanthine phosphoribosyltransferase n=1 Tax=marine sediment metagenome TaxID=412755 RepID=A0A0F9VGD5_9ZZZZ